MASPTRVSLSDDFHRRRFPSSAAEMPFFSDHGGAFLKNQLCLNDDAWDGFSTCTEVLGFESSTGRGFSGEDSCSNTAEMADTAAAEGAAEGRRREEERRSFPPLLSSLSMDGRPCFSLTQRRRAGRLEVNSVRIRRPEFFMASREDGRLRMYLVREEEGGGDCGGGCDGDCEVCGEEGAEDGGGELWRWPEVVCNRVCQGQGRRQQCVR